MDFNNLVAQLEQLSDTLVQDVGAVGRVVAYLQTPATTDDVPPYEVLYGSVPTITVAGVAVELTALPPAVQRDILKSLAAATLDSVKQRANSLQAVAAQVSETIDHVLKEW